MHGGFSSVGFESLWCRGFVGLDLRTQWVVEGYGYPCSGWKDVGGCDYSVGMGIWKGVVVRESCVGRRFWVLGDRLGCFTLVLQA